MTDTSKITKIMKIESSYHFVIGCPDDRMFEFTRPTLNGKPIRVDTEYEVKIGDKIQIFQKGLFGFAYLFESILVYNQVKIVINGLDAKVVDHEGDIIIDYTVE